MKYLDFIKTTDNLDKYIVLMDELGYTDAEIVEKLEIGGRQTLYDARKRQESILEALKAIGAPLPDKRNKDIQLIIDTFVNASGVTKTSKWDRFAAKRLADKHGAENIAQLIEVYFKLPPGQYKPSIASIRQLEEKWVNVGAYMQKQSVEAPIDQ